MNRNRFDALSTSLNDLLEEIGSGKKQLPDFQRGWVWDDSRIRSLIASVSQAFPIGAVMTLETGNPDVCFKARVLKGVNSENVQSEPDELILDGQQRLTALFQSLMSKDGVYTIERNEKEIVRYYYLDMEQCVKDDIERERAVLSCRKDRPLLQTFRGEAIDLSSSEQKELVKKQYEHAMFPVHQIFDADDWGDGYKKFWEENPPKRNVFNQFNRKVIECFKLYSVPVICLKKDTSREAVCLVFEKVNTKGVTLTVFELLTASFAAKNFLLRDDWKKRANFFKKSEVLRKLDNTSFLRAVSLLVYGSCKRGDILRLDVEDYKRVANKVQDGFVKAAEFLNKQKIYSAIDVPYQTQLAPLAAILASLGDDGEKIGPQDKISRWYWCGVFGEMYAGSTDTQASLDFSEVTSWVKGEGNEPTIFRDANFHANRVLDLRTRGSAAYKGCYALLVSYGCHDFLMEKTAEDMERRSEDIDIHHIFPKNWCKKQKSPKITKEFYDNIINKTPLSASTNRMIGDKAPSEYLRKIQEKARIETTDKIDEILASHLICPNTLRNDDFDGFFKARKEALLEAIKKAMGKNVIREDEKLSNLEE